MTTHRLRSGYRIACSALAWAALVHGVWNILGAAPELSPLWAAAAYLLIIGGAATTAAHTDRALWSAAPSTTVLGLSVLALTPLPVWPGLGSAALVVAAVAGLRIQEDYRAPSGQVLLVAVVAIALVPLHLVLSLRSVLPPRRDG